MKYRSFLFAMMTICMMGAHAQGIDEMPLGKDVSALGGEALLKTKTTVLEQEKSVVQFRVSVATSGNYHLSFWCLPAEISEGVYSVYSVKVNGEDAGIITFSQPDWQMATLSQGQATPLDAGDNLISIEATAPDIPSVEFVHIATNASDAVNVSNAYDQYKSSLSRSITRSVGLSFPSPSSIVYDPPLNNYEYSLGVPVKYTFSKSLSLRAGDDISVFYSSVNHIPTYLEIFNESDPGQFSLIHRSNAVLDSLEVGRTLIPVSGNYKFIVRPQVNGDSGLCNVYITVRPRNSNQPVYYGYNNVPVNGYSYVCQQDADHTYENFTCHSTGDPYLCVEEMGTDSCVHAFNDNYNGTAYYDWGDDARITKKFQRPVHSVFVSTASSYAPESVCDLYMKCLKGTDDLWGLPYLTMEDHIESSPYNYNYNCYSWAGGITSYWEDPTSPFSTSYETIESVAFNHYFWKRGLSGYSGADSVESVVDLWSIYSATEGFVHASIRKGADPNAHGFDWESKLGECERIFHPRDILKGGIYGQIVKYYIRNPELNALNSLEEEIAEGQSTIEHIGFTERENAVIDSVAERISNGTRLDFEKKYATWRASVRKFSSTKQMRTVPAYKEILALCKENKNCPYLLYKKMNEDDFHALVLLEDVVLPDHQPLLEDVRERNKALENTETGAEIYRSPLTNGRLFVKKILKTEYKALANETEMPEIKLSNSDEFTVSCTGRKICISLPLEEQAKVSLIVSDVTGEFQSTLLNNEIMSSDRYQYCYTVNHPGIYLVRYVKGGNVNVKKIEIK